MDEVKTCSEAVDIAMDDRKHAQRHDGRYRDVFDVTADDVEGRNSKKKKSGNLALARDRKH